jgi:biopolymer transport protein ExbB
MKLYQSFLRNPMKHFIHFILLAILAGPLAAQELGNINTNALSDLKLALAELTNVNHQIETERIPLATQLRELEQTLAERRTAYGKAQRFQENQLVELNALKAEAKHRSEEVKYIDALLSEYGKNFEARLNFIEVPQYRAMLDVVEKAGLAPDLAAADAFQQRSVLLTTSLQRSEASLGGQLIDGQALDKQGLVQKGKVALVGPVAMFASSSGTIAGPLQMELNKSDPTVVMIDKKLAEAGRTLAATGRGQLALDPTLGNAFKLSALKQSLFERISKGGWVMAPLLTLGFAMLIVSLFKWIQLSRIRLAKESDLQKVLRHLEQDEKPQALAHARSIKGPSGELLATAVEHSDEKKEYIEEILYEKMLGTRTKLERGIAFLALTATAGPLMGLLGTVMGMIATFKLISSFGSGDPKLLASGISEALIATATGMSVAIPALLLHAFLSRKAKTVLGSMEQTAVGFVNGIPQSERPAFT